MKKIADHKIVIVGCGNVAWQIAVQLKHLKVRNVVVANHRNNPFLKEFRTKLGFETLSDFRKLDRGADFYFLCVSDKSISSVAKKLQINNPEATLLHTSGSTQLSALGKSKPGRAVFYPLQSFSKDDNINWKEVPVLIEADSKKTERKVLLLANKFSNTVMVVNSDHRLRLHLAAVIVNNFTNALYAEAYKFLKSESKRFDFDLLMPLITKTTSKLDTMSPLKAQTGPAKRKDREIMSRHLELLDNFKELKHLYKLLSDLIIKQQADLKNEF